MKSKEKKSGNVLIVTIGGRLGKDAKIRNVQQINGKKERENSKEKFS
jgi:hypothetical protein